MKHLLCPRTASVSGCGQAVPSGDRACEHPSSAMVCHSRDSMVQGAEDDSSLGSAQSPC